MEKERRREKETLTHRNSPRFLFQRRKGIGFGDFIKKREVHYNSNLGRGGGVSSRLSSGKKNKEGETSP